VLTDTRDAMEEARMGALSGGAGEDGVFECLRLETTAGAGGVRVGRPPSELGGQLTLPGSHLMNPSGHELA